MSALHSVGVRMKLYCHRRMVLCGESTNNPSNKLLIATMLFVCACCTYCVDCLPRRWSGRRVFCLSYGRSRLLPTRGKMTSPSSSVLARKSLRLITGVKALLKSHMYLLHMYMCICGGAEGISAVWSLQPGGVESQFFFID